MTAQELIAVNYDPDNLKWLKVEIKEGDKDYVEGERRFKVWTLGSNIYDSSGGESYSLKEHLKMSLLKRWSNSYIKNWNRESRTCRTNR